MSNNTTDTTRPAVAIVSYHEHGGAVVDVGGPEYFLGFWQPDGDWSDIAAGPGGTGLLATMRDRVGEQVAVHTARVTWQDFDGEMWDRTYSREDLEDPRGIASVADDGANRGESQ